MIMKFWFSAVIMLFSSVLLAQDIIIKRDGSEISCKVERIGSIEIEFRRADQSVSGPIYSIAKSEVFMVRYKDGTKDVFNPITNTPVEKSEPLTPAPAPAPAPSPVPITPAPTQISNQPQNPPSDSYTSNSTAKESADSRNRFMRQSFMGYGGSYWAPFGLSEFAYFPSGWGVYGNVRFQFAGLDYDAYTISNGMGGVYIVDAYDSGTFDMQDYERDNDWKLFYNRTTFTLGASKILGTDLGRLIFPGVYGGLGLTRETRYYPYWSSSNLDYIIVKDSENSSLGMELELGVCFIVERFHANTGFAFNTSLGHFDWAFGLAFDFYGY